MVVRQKTMRIYSYASPAALHSFRTCDELIVFQFPRMGIRYLKVNGLASRIGILRQPQLHIGRRLRKVNQRLLMEMILIRRPRLDLARLSPGVNSIVVKRALQRGGVQHDRSQMAFLEAGVYRHG